MCNTTTPPLVNGDLWLLDLQLSHPVEQQFRHLVSAKYYNLDLVQPPCASIMLLCSDDAEPFGDMIDHLSPPAELLRAGSGEITPVHPFNHPSFLISSQPNPDRSALKLT